MSFLCKKYYSKDVFGSISEVWLRGVEFRVIAQPPDAGMLGALHFKYENYTVVFVGRDPWREYCCWVGVATVVVGAFLVEYLKNVAPE